MLVAYLVPSIFLTVFGCRPVSASWNLASMPGSKCIDKNEYYITTSALNVLTDIAIILLPWKIVLRLVAPMKQKIATGGIFFAGIM